MDRLALEERSNCGGSRSGFMATEVQSDGVQKKGEQFKNDIDTSSSGVQNFVIRLKGPLSSSLTTLLTADVVR